MPSISIEIYKPDPKNPIDFSKEGRLYCVKCRDTTIHERQKRNKRKYEAYHRTVHICKKCGNVVTL